MNTNRYIIIVGLSALVYLTGCDKESDSRVAPTPSNTRPDSRQRVTEPDNTAKNERDRSGDTKTPMDQSESRDDIKITAEIRRAIMDDNTLSMNAKNCKIVTDKSGVVTLRGPVNSQAEKDSIGAKAMAVAGVSRVDNQLEVETN